MPRFPFYWIDCFTRSKMGGNPCAVLLHADSLSAKEMQAIASEMNLSETAFVCKARTAPADFSARYFTPEGELPFAGHPTVAVTHALKKSGLLSGHKLTLEVPAGMIQVTLRTLESFTEVSMTQLAPTFLKNYSAEEVLPIFGLTRQDLLPEASIQTVSTGTPILMVPLVNAEALRKVRYADVPAYERLKAAGDFMFVHHFILEGATRDGHTFARSLGVPNRGFEDPFTGSATGCMGAYLWRNKLITAPRFTAQQGHWMNRPGTAEVELIGSAADIQGIKVSGGAVTLMSGLIDP